MLKRVDVAVYDLISKLVSGELQGGTVQQYGLPQGGVGLSEMVYTRQLIPRAFMDQVTAAQEAIIAGDLSVIDTRTITQEQRDALYADRTCAGMQAPPNWRLSNTPQATMGGGRGHALRPLRYRFRLRNTKWLFWNCTISARLFPAACAPTTASRCRSTRARSAGWWARTALANPR
jgi:hypothetical protein